MARYLVVGRSLVTLATHKPDYIENVDGDFSKTEYIDTTDDGGRRIVNGKPDAGRPLKPVNIPTRLRRVDPYPQGLSDLYSAPFGYYVSDRMKALIERFEPGVHQFFPAEVESGKQVLGRLHYFVICNRIDGLAPDACVPPIKPENRVYQASYTSADKIVLNGKAIAGYHLWRDRRDFPSMMSEAFYQAGMAEGMVGLSSSDPLEEVGQDGVVLAPGGMETSRRLPDGTLG